VRIPLAAFGSMREIRAVRLVFDCSPAGEVAVTSVRAVK